MNQLYMVVILAFLMLLADATSIKTCKENTMCDKEECCVRGVCMPFIPVGKRCNLLAQIMRMQCPCAVGSSCISSIRMHTFPMEKMSCQNIESLHYLEMVENRDLKHIENNSIED